MAGRAENAPAAAADRSIEASGLPALELPPAWSVGGLFGPGHLLVMLAPGPAELLLWPWLALLVGPSAALLVIAAGLLLALPWLHLSRYLVATGASALSGAGRLHPLVLGACAALGLSQAIWPGQLILAGLALEYVTGGGLGWQPVVLAGLVLIGLLLAVAPRRFGVLQATQAVLLGLAALVSLAAVPIVAVLAALGPGPVGPYELPIAGPGRPDALLAAAVALGLLSRVGLQPLWHTLYLRDKRAGLATHAPRAPSAASGLDESLPWPGARIELNLPAADARWRGWQRWTLAESLLASLAPVLPALALIAITGLLAIAHDPMALERPTAEVQHNPTLVLAVLASPLPPLAVGLALLVAIAAFGLAAASFDAQARGQAETLLQAPGLAGRASVPALYRTSLFVSLALAGVALAAGWTTRPLLLVELLAVVSLAGAGAASLLALAVANVLLPPVLRPNHAASAGLLIGALFWLGWSFAALLAIAGRSAP